jgi:serine/threonine-protein kinase
LDAGFLVMTANMSKQIVGDYKLIDHIGAGGMGEVYRAEHLRIGRIVAVKILKHVAPSSSATERFLNEARVHSSLSHPNIATLYEFFEKDNHVCIAMEFVDGQTLNDCITKKGKIDIDKTLPLFKQVLSAVHYIHQCNIIHRDIKSTNIKITSTNEIKLLDFGIAKAPFSAKLTSDGAFVGTL